MNTPFCETSNTESTKVQPEKSLALLSGNDMEVYFENETSIRRIESEIQSLINLKACLEKSNTQILINHELKKFSNR